MENSQQNLQKTKENSNVRIFEHPWKLMPKMKMTQKQ
jgi:hypothetical protein